MSRKPQKFGEFLTVGKAAQYLGVSAWTLRNWDKAGKLSPLRHPKNGYRIYRHEDLQALRDLSEDGHAPSPAVDWTTIRSSEHCVQLYESDDYLAEAVAQYLMPAMTGDSRAVMVVTHEHRAAIQGRLRALGVDEARIASAARCVWLDAAETLERLMVDGLPDAQRFKAVVGPLICQSSTPLRAFGEMVAMLWLDGKREAAVRLEGLWNALARQHPFALMCAYPISGFGGQGDDAWLGEICRCHTRVIPAESYSGPMERNKRFTAVAELQRKAHFLGNEISHRVDVEKALTRRERELLDFVENASEGLHKVAADGTILWANRAELNILGYMAEEYIGHHISEFHVDADVLDVMLTRLRDGKSLCSHAARLRCKDGSIKHVEVNSNACFEDGLLLYTRCFTRDVTHRWQEQQRQLALLESERAARAQAESVSRLKDEFLATLSHELRTPLNAILGWSQIVKQRPGEMATVMEGIDVIDRNARLQTRLVENLLDLNQIISGKLQLNSQPLELTGVIKAAVESVSQVAAEKRITIVQDLDAQAGRIMGDPTRLQQIIFQLLNNALKFTPEGGRIVVILRRAGAQVELVVTDNGQGISSDFLPHLFEYFRQADASITRRHGGLGIGLSLVKQLVELHGGKVMAQSGGDGQGSTFSLQLPRLVERRTPQAGEEIEAASAGARDLPSYLKGLKVLAVDDEADLRRLLARLLGKYGAQVVTAGSAAEAIEILQGDGADVLISDIGMPQIDGYQLIGAIRAMDGSRISQIPAIALTAFARSEDRTRAMLAGFQVHLAKPVDPGELVVTIASLTGRVAAARCNA